MKKTKNKLPIVSIVIPAYNGATYIKKTIQSVLDQTYTNIELLVLDDGSTDETVEILETFGDSFYWSSHKNIGQSATLNKGWGMAKGEMLSYLSVDDLLEPDAVSKSVKYLLDHPETIMTYGNYTLIDANGCFIKKFNAPEFNYKDLLSKVIVQPGPGVFFRRDAFQQIGGWDTSFHQMPDYDYWLRLGLLGDFKKLPFTLASFRVHEDSQTYAESSIKKSEECLMIMNKYFSNAQLPIHLRYLESTAYSYAHIFSARTHIRSGRYLLGINHICKAIEKNKRALFSFWTVKLLFFAIKYRIQRKLFIMQRH